MLAHRRTAQLICHLHSARRQGADAVLDGALRAGLAKVQYGVVPDGRPGWRRGQRVQMLSVCTRSQQMLVKCSGS